MRVYDDAVKDLQPSCCIIQKRTPIDQNIKRTSEGYQLGVLVQPPNSVTYVGPSPTKTALLQSRPMIIAQAQALSYEVDIQEETPWAVFSRLGDDAAAIEDYFLLLEMAMMRVGKTRHELSLMSGGTSIGTVESVSGSASAASIVITAATYRSGLFWALGPGATMDAFTSSTKNNSTAAIVLAGVSQSAPRTINVTCGGTLSSEITAGDTLWLEAVTSDGGTTVLDMPGLVSQAANVSGTSMGLSAATYPNWSGNADSVGGPLTSDVLETYLGNLRNRQQDGKLTVFLPEAPWRQIFEEVQGMRFIDSGYNASEQKIGNEMVSYTTTRFKNVELVVHQLLRDQEALIIKEEALIRVGSRDVEFGIPIRLGGNPADPSQGVLQVNGYNTGIAYVTSDVGILNREPSCSYSLTGITPS